jgi:osmoprotectant transport system permease protein
MLTAAAAALAALYLFAGGSLARDFLAAGNSRIRIGAKTFTEQYILSAILAGQIERETGIRTELVQSLGSTVVFDALRSGDIDAYVDYSGTIWATVMHRAGGGATRAELLAEVERHLREQAGIAVACALGFENAYALAMRRETAERLGVRRISDLAPHAHALAIGADYEFFSRTEWKALETAYRLAFASRRSMDPSLMYQAVSRGNVDVISAYSTDGRIAALELVVLEDDKGAIPPYDAIVLVNAGLQGRHPQAFRALQALAGKIDAAAMRRMNLAVDEQNQSPAGVARAFLAKLPRL